MGKFIVHRRLWATFARVGGQMREGMSERYERIDVQSLILLYSKCDVLHVFQTGLGKSTQIHQP